MVSLYSFLKYAINLSTSVFEEITMICFQVMLGKYEEICNKLIKKNNHFKLNSLYKCLMKNYSQCLSVTYIQTKYIMM